MPARASRRTDPRDRLCEHNRPRMLCHKCSRSAAVCRHHRRALLCSDCGFTRGARVRVSRCTLCRGLGHYARTCPLTVGRAGVRVLPRAGADACQPPAPTVDWAECELCGRWHVHLLAQSTMRFECAHVGRECQRRTAMPPGSPSLSSCADAGEQEEDALADFGLTAPDAILEYDDIEGSEVCRVLAAA